ncbi:MAG: hypothetical protein ACREO9_03650 [Lysobacterales bacterium]
MFLLDLEQQIVNLALDWNTAGIDWRGRGFELGLRAIAIDGDVVYLAAGDELFAYSPQFERIASWRNPWLKQCRAMAIHERMLFLSSAAFDCILGFNLDEQAFNWAMRIEAKGDRYAGAYFDSAGSEGPLPLNKLELTDLHCNADGMYLSGLNTGGMLHFNGKTIFMSAELPPGARNAQPFRQGVLFIDNEVHSLRYCGRRDETEDRALALPNFRHEDLLHKDTDLSGEAQAGFGRGLCVLNDRAVAVGVSPATIALYDLQENRQLFLFNLSSDVRTAIHSIAIWPYP